MNLPSSRAYAGFLALVRLLTGAIWLIHAIPKFLQSDRFMPPNGIFGTYVQQGIARTTGPLHDFIAGVVQPNAAIFAELLRLAEVLVGISLVLGLFTRLGALIGVVVSLSYLAIRAEPSTVSGGNWPAMSLALLSAISLFLPTGRVMGFDALFARPRRRPVVTPQVVPERPLSGPTAPPS
jgi:thiosulfate dehydrogenase [quinone] large subunit